MGYSGAIVKAVSVVKSSNTESFFLWLPLSYFVVVFGCVHCEGVVVEVDSETGIGARCDNEKNDVLLFVVH